MQPEKRALCEALKEMACAATALAAAIAQRDTKWSERLRAESWQALNEAMDKVTCLSGVPR
jgi:hypothetical protein